MPNHKFDHQKQVTITIKLSIFITKTWIHFKNAWQIFYEVKAIN